VFNRLFGARVLLVKVLSRFLEFGLPLFLRVAILTPSTMVARRIAGTVIVVV
jgi:hypothetical protein